MKDFYHLLIQELKDVYDAEKQMALALPEMSKVAHDPKLKYTLDSHLEETKEQIERLKEISEELKENLTGSTCEGMQGLLSEARKMLGMRLEKDVKDAAIISEAQRIEHYEIAAYGTLVAYARHLKLDRVENLLKKTLKEEKSADKNLTSVAEGNLFTKGINEKAVND